MKEAPKIVDEMQKIKDIITNYTVAYKLINDSEYDRQYNQLNSIFCTANNIQKEISKKIIKEIDDDLNILLNQTISKKYTIKNLSLNIQISNDEISISFLGKKLFYKKDENFYLMIESLLQQEDDIKEWFSNYIKYISIKLSNYIDSLNKNEDIKYMISFSKNHNLNEYEISITGSYEDNDCSSLKKCIDDFMEMSIQDLLLNTDVIPISKFKIDTEIEMNKELKI